MPDQLGLLLVRHAIIVDGALLIAPAALQSLWTELFPSVAPPTLRRQIATALQNLHIPSCSPLPASVVPILLHHLGHGYILSGASATAGGWKLLETWVSTALTSVPQRQREGRIVIAHSAPASAASSAASAASAGSEGSIVISSAGSSGPPGADRQTLLRERLLTKDVYESLDRAALLELLFRRDQMVRLFRDELLVAKRKIRLLSSSSSGDSSTSLVLAANMADDEFQIQHRAKQWFGVPAGYAMATGGLK
jgi:hypothetical protein